MRLTFATCWDESYDAGAEVLLRSIRKFYPPDAANIVAMYDERPKGDKALAWMKGMEVDRLPTQGVNPLKMKAYVTDYCLRQRMDELVLHIDADAFLLGRLDLIMQELSEEDTVLGFRDKTTVPPIIYTAVTGTTPLDGDSDYRLNGGVVFWRNGEGVRVVVRQFSAAVDTGWLWAAARHDQHILQAVLSAASPGIALVVKPHGLVVYGGDIAFDGAGWRNVDTDSRALIWHGVSTHKPWRGDAPAGVMKAWKELGGK